MEGLPKYEITIDEQYKEGEENLGIDMIAFTNKPAVIVKGVAFNSQKREYFADNKKYRITAPAMIPSDIYRRDDDGTEYEVVFTEAVIDEMHKKFMSDLNNKDLFNLEHNAAHKAPAFILEAWIVDKPREDKAFSTFGIDVPKGTLMITAQITDQNYYNDLIEQGRTGFSIEGFLGLKQAEQLNQYNMSQTDFTPEEGKTYEFINGAFQVVEKEVAMAEVTVEEEVKEEVMGDMPKEEEMAEAPVAEEPVVEEEMAVDPATDSDAIMAIVAPLLDERINEVLQVIADLKNEMAEAATEADAPEVEVEMSSAKQGFSNLLKFINQNG